MRTLQRRRGFTLIELLVVIVIVSILAALLVVLVKGMVERSRNMQTKALVEILDRGCAAYRADTGTVPPLGPYTGSQNLHFYLGAPRTLVVQEGTPPLTASLPPLIEFRREWLDPSAPSTLPNPPSTVVDAWGNAIEVENPGAVNVKAVDLRSRGRDISDPGDDLTNYVRDW